jgi:hypothetical protein
MTTNIKSEVRAFIYVITVPVIIHSVYRLYKELKYLLEFIVNSHFWNHVYPQQILGIILLITIVGYT